MKKFTLILISILSISLLAVAQIKFVVYLNDDKPVELLAENVDSITFGTSQSEGETPIQPSSPKTLYFINTENWNEVLVYLWVDGVGSEYAPWPGVKATKENYSLYGYKVYSYDLSGIEKFDKIIFNNGSPGDGNQTSDLNINYETPCLMYDEWYSSKEDAIRNSIHNGHVYVDLGLPSGLLWATCNVGADSPEDNGDYFAWGETEPKDYYHWETYKLSANGNYYSMTKYCLSTSYGTVDNKNILELSDDAANANWGGDWRMPTKEEMDELCNKCTWTKTTINGVDFYKITSRSNGRSIIWPLAGYRDGYNLKEGGELECYWSSSLYDGGYSYFAFCKSDDYLEDRHIGFSVRPVLSKD